MFPALFAISTLANVAHGIVQQQNAQNGLNSLVKPKGYEVTPGLALE